MSEQHSVGALELHAQHIVSTQKNNNQKGGFGVGYGGFSVGKGGFGVGYGGFGVGTKSRNKVIARLTEFRKSSVLSSTY